ncbi:hypothetical protein B0T22DRAFT_466368 [Podospora appendiculata]|uniref:Uncharacterized protein n=1 Tax=Podospora appendiculata TaxID=314037 RepID=A0AAE0X6I2_9PEZI|nr:hypothetical protein B0T22DRAFT_466368 [Podospora appendiculata]
MIRSPVMMAVPELDYISPPDEQEAAFGKVIAPGSKLHFALGKSHMNVATGEGGAELVRLTGEFLRGVLSKGAHLE